ncbi:hypothetical protein D3C71_2152320 [compost metagenome]
MGRPGGLGDDAIENGADDGIAAGGGVEFVDDLLDQGFVEALGRVPADAGEARADGWAGFGHEADSEVMR